MWGPPSDCPSSEKEPRLVPFLVTLAEFQLVRIEIALFKIGPRRSWWRRSRGKEAGGMILVLRYRYWGISAV